MLITLVYLINENSWGWEFHGNPVGTVPASTAGGTGSVPDQGTKILHATWRKQKKKEKKKIRQIVHLRDAIFSTHLIIQ